MNISKKISIPILIFITIISLVYIFSRPVIIQDLAYHNFIDSRPIWGIPNFFDVISNILFLVFGLMGLIATIKNKQLITKKSWIVFFVGVILVAPGSAYYHWAPDNHTLVWDRLPMTIGFMALYIALLAEHINPKLEMLLIPCCLLGLISVFWWDYSQDLRLYYWVQMAPIFSIPVVLALFTSRYTGKIWFLVVLAFYLLAKIVEHRDPEVFSLTNGIMSGHTLKHILAAVAILFLWYMINTRKTKEFSYAS